MTPRSRPAPAAPPTRRPAAARRHLLEPVGERVGPDHADALLVTAGRGDLTAFAAFYDETSAVVFGTLCHVSGRSPRAERAVEDVYGQLWRAAPDFDPAVRSAYSTVLSLTRRAAAGLVHELVTEPPVSAASNGEDR